MKLILSYATRDDLAGTCKVIPLSLPCPDDPRTGGASAKCVTATGEG